MKRSLKPLALAAAGVFLGRAAFADTLLTFDASPPGQGQNAQILQTFGDNAADSSPGVLVTGVGTPDIRLNWQSTGGRWDYYIDAVWSAGQLDSSGIADLHEIVFTPSAPAAVIIKSFNFHPYYDNTLDYSYDWRVLDGGNVLTNGSLTFICDATRNHPVTINYQGSLGQVLTLQLERTGGSDGTQNIAIDDVRFAQFPEPTGPAVTFVTPGQGQTSVAPEIAFRASLKDGSTAVATNTILLSLNDNTLSPVITRETNVTTVSYQTSGLLPAGTNRYTLVFRDNAATPTSYTNELQFVVAAYVNLQLPAPVIFENFDATAEGGLPSGWSQTNYTEVLNPDLDLGNLDSASYATWVVVNTARFTNSFVGYSDTNAAPVDYSQVLTANPSNVVNGASVKNLATGRFLIGNSGYRFGRSQVMYLFTPDFDLTGKANMHLSFHSLWEQNQDSIGAVEYSIDQGQTWLPIVYMLDGPDMLLDAGNAVDPVATLSTGAQTADEAIAFYTDPADGQDKGGTYGAFVGVAQNQWTGLAPFISARVNDDPVESKRVEFFRLPQADNQAKVRFRFAHAGTDSWYFGIDDFGLYSMPRPTLSVSVSGNSLTVSWPTSEAGFTLESANSLANPAWGPVGGVTNNSVTVTATPGNKFYRLRR
ncbi:MAG TPA: hypothetical protein VJW76_07515 [Verrucomicrobiae bacterium]|nr:hypothetical protein [Verrucomicrobiae bacterium]